MFQNPLTRSIGEERKQDNELFELSMFLGPFMIKNPWARKVS